VEDSANSLSNVIRIDDERIEDRGGERLGRARDEAHVLGPVQETDLVDDDTVPVEEQGRLATKSLSRLRTQRLTGQVYLTQNPWVVGPLQCLLWFADRLAKRGHIIEVFATKK